MTKGRVAHHVPQVVMVADPGPDPDDVKGILLAAHFHSKRKIQLLGVVCCGGGQARERAKLAKRVLELAYPKLSIDIGVGTSGDNKPHTPAPHEYDLEGWADVDASRFPVGVNLLLDKLRAADKKSVTVEIQASFSDVAEVIDKHRELFLAKVERVCAMGGVKNPTAEEDWESDAAFNNDLDSAAATKVYQFCQKERLPLVVVARDAVPALGMVEMRRIAAESDHPVMQYLSQAQDGGLVALYKRVCDRLLPERCSKEWFFTTFCGLSKEGYAEFAAGQPGGEPPDDIDIRSHLNGTVKPYDPMTLLSVLDKEVSRQWFDWEGAEVRVGGVAHYFFQTPEHVKSKQIIQTIVELLALTAKANSNKSDCGLSCVS